MPPTIALLMGSSSDWETLRHAAEILDRFQVHYDKRVVSAHRMPDDMFAFADSAQARGLRAIIAGAGGAAHLPGMLAAGDTVMQQRLQAFRTEQTEAARAMTQDLQ